MNVKIPDEQSMLDFGAALSKAAEHGAIIYLIGDLGAGKTTLARGFLRAYGHKGPIRSPTYTLVENYSLSHREVFHIDLYRLSDPEEVEYLGLRDLITETSIGLIEWPEKAKDMIPPADISCSISFDGKASREINLSAYTERGTTILNALVIK